MLNNVLTRVFPSSEFLIKYKVKKQKHQSFLEFNDEKLWQFFIFIINLCKTFGLENFCGSSHDCL